MVDAFLWFVTDFIKSGSRSSYFHFFYAFEIKFIEKQRIVSIKRICFLFYIVHSVLCRPLLNLLGLCNITLIGYTFSRKYNSFNIKKEGVILPSGLKEVGKKPTSLHFYNLGANFFFLATVA